jgi:hypothetical protein
MEGIYARFKNQLSDFLEKKSSGLSDPKTLRKMTKKYHFLSLPRRPNHRRLRRRHSFPCNLLTNSKKPAIRPLFGLIRPKSAAESGGGLPFSSHPHLYFKTIKPLCHILQPLPSTPGRTMVHQGFRAICQVGGFFFNSFLLTKTGKGREPVSPEGGHASLHNYPTGGLEPKGSIGGLECPMSSPPPEECPRLLGGCASRIQALKSGPCAPVPAESRGAVPHQQVMAPLAVLREAEVHGAPVQRLPLEQVPA